MYRWVVCSRSYVELKILPNTTKTEVSLVNGESIGLVSQQSVLSFQFSEPKQGRYKVSDDLLNKKLQVKNKHATYEVKQTSAGNTSLAELGSATQKK